MKVCVLFIVLATILSLSAGAYSQDLSGLSYLSDWSAFVQSGVSLHDTDNQGRFAAGGDVSLTDYEVGTLLNASDCKRIDLLVGGALTFDNGAVPNGEILAASASVEYVTTECSPVDGTSPIDFDTAFGSLATASSGLASLSPNGQVQVSGATLTLVGTSADKNIFSVEGSQLPSTTQINLQIPGGSFAIINIDGAENDFENLQIDLSADTSYRYIIWNFFETKFLTITGISVSGSVLAPAASVSFNNGNIQGSIAAFSINGTGEIHLYPLLPFCPPCQPCGGSGSGSGNITLPNWSIFVLNDVSLNNTDDRGNFAAGGNVWLTHYEVGADLEDVPGVADLIVGGNLQFNSGEVVNGNVLVGGTANVTNFGVVNGQLYSNSPIPIDFDDEFDTLSDLSSSLSQLSPNGQVSSGFGGVVNLLGSEIGLNVFEVDGSLLSTVTQLNISVPFNSWVIVNVANTEIDQIVDLQINLNGINATNVLYNFYEATNINVAGVRIQGSILAPSASVVFTNGAIDGSLYASSLNGDGEIHHYPWIPPSCSPCPPCNGF